jgi:hypothetical protein
MILPSKRNIGTDEMANMKFNAEYNTTMKQWFVKTYKKAKTQYGVYFDTEQAAKELALVETIKFYESKKYEAFGQLKAICPNNIYGDAVRLTDQNDYATLGDLTC